MTQREPGELPREQNEAEENPKVRGNETKENPKGTPKGSSRVTNGARRASIVPRRIPKGSKGQEDSKGKQKEARRAKGGPGRHQRVSRVAKGAG